MHDDMRKRGTGSIGAHRMPDGSVRFRVRIVVEGKRRSLGLYDSESLAAEVLAAALRELRGERHWTLRRWGAEWLDAREVRDRMRGIAQERSCWATHVETAPFVDWPLSLITRRDVLRWAKSLRDKHATVVVPGGGRKSPRHGETTRRLSRDVIGRAISLLRCCLREAADEEMIDVNPATDVRPPKREERDVPWTFLSADEIAAVLHHANAGVQVVLYTVAIHTGLRAGEIWGLRWRDVDLARRELTVCRSYRNATKARRIRRVPMLPAAHDALTVLQAVRPGIGDALVFPADHGGCHARSYDAGWTSLKRRAGVLRRVRFHDIRHTCASHLTMGTWTKQPLGLNEVREWMGHSTLAMTLRYAHLSPGWLHSVAAGKESRDGNTG